MLAAPSGAYFLGTSSPNVDENLPDFFDFVSLPEAAVITKIYVDTAMECTSVADLVRLTHAMLSYANRLHMCVDFILPWGVGDGFRRKKTA